MLGRLLPPQVKDFLFD